jgi:hypothetical protein
MNRATINQSQYLLPTTVRPADISRRNPHSPDSGPADAWASQGATPEARAARQEVVRLFTRGATHPSSELSLIHCDPQACLDLPDDLVDAYAAACTSSDPPTSRLILPPGLTDVPSWILKFRALTQLVAHGFAGDAHAALTLLNERCPDLACDFGTVRQLDVQAATENTTLRSIYRPYVGTLDEDAKKKLENFMGKVRDVASMTPGSDEHHDYHVGGFKVVRSHDGGLELSKLAAPPYVASSLGPHQKANLPKTIEVFNAHFDDVQFAVWQAMYECGYVAYLRKNAATLIDGEWDILVNIDPYFGRRPTQNLAHKDTEGENMFLMLFYCNDQAQMGLEYQLRPRNPRGYVKIMEHQLPSVFVDEVKDVLKDPPDGKAYAPTVGPWSFIAACDETMVHSTPFPHHRGAFELQSVIDNIPSALEECFGPGAKRDYLNVRASPTSTDNAWAQGAHTVAVQLEKLLRSDNWIDRDELEKLLRDAKLEDADVKKLISALADMAATEDPFDGIASIFIPRFNYAADIEVPRGKDLVREMSEKLDKGTALPYPESRDYLRVWIMARRKVA